MQNALLDWIKLNIAVPSGARVCSLVTRFGSASAIYGVGRQALSASRCVDEKCIDAILGVDVQRAESIYQVCLANKWHMISPDSEHYPKEFLKLKDFPLMLYCEGDIELLNKSEKIAVVGTRKPSDFSLAATYLLACCLSSLDIATVSGGALGIDTSAHEGSLTGNGGTISVMGCGLDARYLPENSFLRKRIAKNGLIISEYPPFQMPTAYTFPKRNRLIASLGKATVVAQSGTKGGSLITADYTKQYGKPLFCFDESIVSSPGCSLLLKQGALSFQNPEELLLKSGIEIKAANALMNSCLHMDLHNDGIKGIHIIKPSSMTPDAFALYNGITPQEARRVMGNRLKKPKHSISPPQTPVPVEKGISHGGLKSEAEEKETGTPVSGSQPKNTRLKEKTEKNGTPKKVREKTAEEKPKTDLSFLSFISENAKKVYEKLSSAPMLMDEIQYVTSLPSGLVMSAVTELELCDAVTLHTGNRVSKR